jgi:hypothetical protein
MMKGGEQQIMNNPLIKPAKEALAKVYGYKNVSVRNGCGTASGWVEVSITTKKVVGVSVREEAWKIMYAAWEKEGLKPYNYAADDGEGSTRDCVLVDVTYAEEKSLLDIVESGDKEASSDWVKRASRGEVMRIM